MAKTIDLLNRYLDVVRMNNPYKLVLKGGTALAIHHLKGHRESEDLDFDVDTSFKGQVDEIVDYLIDNFRKMVIEGSIRDFRVMKKDMAATLRYHMSIILFTHKEIHTKIDLDFVDIPPNLEYEGELGFYSRERMFVGKSIAFIGRKEFKDLFDIAHLLKIIDPDSFPEPVKLSALIDDVISILEKEEIITSYQKAFRNIDMHFKGLKEHQVKGFVEKTIRHLRSFRNMLLHR